MIVGLRHKTDALRKYEFLPPVLYKTRLEETAEGWLLHYQHRGKGYAAKAEIKAELKRRDLYVRAT